MTSGQRRPDPAVGGPWIRSFPPVRKRCRRWLGCDACGGERVGVRRLLPHEGLHPGCGRWPGSAQDWADLPDRMHYIADMFRCHALRDDLLALPFTAQQVVALKAGRRPDGAL